MPYDHKSCPWCYAEENPTHCIDFWPPRENWCENHKALHRKGWTPKDCIRCGEPMLIEGKEFYCRRCGWSPSLEDFFKPNEYVKCCENCDNQGEDCSRCIFGLEESVTVILSERGYMISDKEEVVEKIIRELESRGEKYTKHYENVVSAKRLTKKYLEERHEVKE